MTSPRHLVLLETSGNQDYLFATNRLKENVGASELTYRSGTRLVLQAVRELGGPDLYSSSPTTLRDSLCDHAPSGGIEVVIATSGKALLLVEDAAKARDLVGLVTGRALRHAPGLDLCGVVSDRIDWARDSLDEAVRGVHRLFETVRGNRPHPSARFPTLPVVQPCASSGLPAAGIETTPGGPLPLSRPVVAKRDAADDWLRRLGRILPNGWATPSNSDRLEEHFGRQTWLAVVHADGNGFGEVFLNFGKYATPAGVDYPNAAARNQVYVDKIRRVSIALEEATETAFTRAMHTFGDVIRLDDDNSVLLPVVPLVLGGDDLTVICEGTHALEFARSFLAAFEQESASDRRDGILPELAMAAHKRKHFSACAGVAIVKHHFPFHHAYDLAEELLKSAKKVKKRARVDQDGKRVSKGLSAMDFHILYDASFTNLSPIRKRACADDGSSLFARPYVVTNRDRLDEMEGQTGQGQSNSWAQAHHIDDLLLRVEVIAAKDEADDRAILPSSQLHALREALFRGKGAADAELAQMFERYGPPLAATGHGLEELQEKAKDADPRTLFRRPLEPDWGDLWETRFLDALDTIGFWEGRKQ